MTPVGESPAILWITRRNGVLHRATRAIEELQKLNFPRPWEVQLEIITLDDNDDAAEVTLPPGRWRVFGGEVLEGGFAWSGKTLPPGGVIAFNADN